MSLPRNLKGMFRQYENRFVAISVTAVNEGNGLNLRPPQYRRTSGKFPVLLYVLFRELLKYLRLLL